MQTLTVSGLVLPQRELYCASKVFLTHLFDGLNTLLTQLQLRVLTLNQFVCTIDLILEAVVFA
jgi:short-subunit dehydrogenase